jgi:hypothetical protein
VIYPEYTLQQWLALHDGLEVKTVSCRNCGLDIKSTIPFIDKHYLGLTSRPCSCGNVLTRIEIAKPRTKEEQLKWDIVLNSMRG